MGMGIAFTFLGLALLVAPILWFVWWAAGSLGNRQVPATAPAVPRPRADVRRTYFDHPQPADSHRPGRPDGITVYGVFGSNPKSYCDGPDARGGCPIAHADGTVPCAGCVLVLPVAVRGSRDWHIPPGYRSCVVGSYAALRQPAGRA